MAYVVQQPNSLTNPSGKFRVVDFDRWKTYADGETNNLPMHSSHDTYAAAVEARDVANAKGEN